MPLRSVVVETSSGKVHTVVEDGRRRLTDERCNLDQVDGELRELELPLAVERARLCGHCFGDVEVVDVKDLPRCD